MNILTVTRRTRGCWRTSSSPSLAWWWSSSLSSSTSPSRLAPNKIDLNCWIIPVIFNQFSIRVNYFRLRELSDKMSFQLQSSVRVQSKYSLVSDNISSYQSVSPADTILPPASPSPLASRRPSGVSGLLSPTPSVHRSRSGSPMMPPGVGGHTMYDRSKLSIPLQRYNISSPPSSSSSPLARSPVSSLDQSLINNPSVARSLRNIKQNSDNKQHIELGLNDKLF